MDEGEHTYKDRVRLGGHQPGWGNALGFLLFILAGALMIWWRFA